MNSPKEKSTIVVTLDKLRIYAYHGVLPQEKAVGNWYDVTVSFSFQSDAVRTDNLNDTINYATIADIIKQQMLVPSKLLERVAGRISEAICSHYPQITSGEISVTKISPPIQGLNSEGVTVTLKF